MASFNSNETEKMKETITLVSHTFQSAIVDSLSNLSKQLVKGITDSGTSIIQSHENTHDQALRNVKTFFTSLDEKISGFSSTIESAIIGIKAVLGENMKVLGSEIRDSHDIIQKRSFTASTELKNTFEHNFLSMFSLIQELSKSASNDIDAWIHKISVNIDQTLLKHFNFTEIASSIRSSALLIATSNENQVQNMGINITTALGTFRISQDTSILGLIQTVERSINASTMAYIKSNSKMLNKYFARSEENIEFILENISNITSLQMKQHNKEIEKLSLAIQKDLVPTIRENLSNATIRVDNSLSSNFNDLKSVISDGTRRNVAVLGAFTNHSREKFKSMEIMSRISEQNLSHAISDLTKILDEKLSAMAAYKPVFDLSHGITREAREKFNNQEREVITITIRK